MLQSVEGHPKVEPSGALRYGAVGGFEVGKKYDAFFLFSLRNQTISQVLVHVFTVN
jgi:hypothetical protein